MRNLETGSQKTIDWAVVSRTAPGEAVCGDAHLIEPLADGVLVAVVDGLGHGNAAAVAAFAAVVSVKEHAGEPLDVLIERCHTALKYTRGAVMTLATVRATDGRLTWAGVGNVEARLLRTSNEGSGSEEYLPLCSGVIGYQVPVVTCHATQMAPGDLLVLCTDGVVEDSAEDIPQGETPQRIAEGILSRHFRGYDDALVLVARRLVHSHESSSE
jgi:phosphoserine phosphatase RsbX